MTELEQGTASPGSNASLPIQDARLATTVPQALHKSGNLPSSFGVDQVVDTRHRRTPSPHRFPSPSAAIVRDRLGSPGQHKALKHTKHPPAIKALSPIHITERPKSAKNLHVFARLTFPSDPQQVTLDQTRRHKCPRTATPTPWPTPSVEVPAPVPTKTAAKTSSTTSQTPTPKNGWNSAIAHPRPHAMTPVSKTYHLTVLNPCPANSSSTADTAADLDAPTAPIQQKNPPNNYTQTPGVFTCPSNSPSSSPAPSSCSQSPSVNSLNSLQPARKAHLIISITNKQGPIVRSGPFLLLFGKVFARVRMKLEIHPRANSILSSPPSLPLASDPAHPFPNLSQPRTPVPQNYPYCPSQSQHPQS